MKIPGHPKIPGNISMEFDKLSRKAQKYDSQIGDEFYKNVLALVERPEVAVISDAAKAKVVKVIGSYVLGSAGKQIGDLSRNLNLGPDPNDPWSFHLVAEIISKDFPSDARRLRNTLVQNSKIETGLLKKAGKS